MGLLDLFRRRQTIITHDLIITIIGNETIVKERHHHHHPHHHGRLIVSSVSLFSQDNPDLIISKTEGDVMAQKFNKLQGVSYKLTFLKTDGTPGAIDPASITAESSDATVATVNPDASDSTVGTILGVADGGTTINFTAKSAVGGAPLTASVTITIDSSGLTPPPPDTSGDATSINVALSDAFNQDGSPVTA